MSRIAVLALAALAAGSAPQAGTAAYPGRNGLIVFSSERRDQSRELFTMRPDGSAQRRLTREAPLGRDPAWSPNGKTIAFALIRDFGHADIWLMRADGTLVRQLARTSTKDESQPIDLDWSPDGKRIAYVRAGRLRVLTIARGTERTLARATASPSWSPDGRRIVFERGGSLRVIGADGRGVRRLGSGTQPDWSPRGGRIAFIFGEGALWTMRSDGSDRVRVTHDDVRFEEDRQPAWAPDGRTIAFVRGELFQGQTAAFIGTISPDGTGFRRVVQADLAQDLTWSPNGDSIAYGVFNEGMICVARADGSAATPLLDGGADWWARWSPNGETLAVLHQGATKDCGRGGIGLFGFDAAGRQGRLLYGTDGTGSWSPDGTQLVVENGAGGLEILDLGTGAARRIVGDSVSGLPWNSEPVWSPDGRWIAWVADDTLSLLGVAGGAAPRVGEPKGRNPDWSPDGKRLAFTYRNAIYVLRLGARRPVRLVRNASQPAWSPDGRKIAFVRTVGRANPEIFVADANGSRQRRLTFHAGVDVAPDWQPLPQRS